MRFSRAVAQVVSKVQDPVEYCEIAEVFVEYLLKHFSVRDEHLVCCGACVCMGVLIPAPQPTGARAEYIPR